MEYETLTNTDQNMAASFKRTKLPGSPTKKYAKEDRYKKYRQLSEKNHPVSQALHMKKQTIIEPCPKPIRNWLQGSSQYNHLDYPEVKSLQKNIEQCSTSMTCFNAEYGKKEAGG